MIDKMIQSGWTLYHRASSESLRFGEAHERIHRNISSSMEIRCPSSLFHLTFT